MNDLIPLAEMIAARLKARQESIAIAESSPGGLISRCSHCPARRPISSAAPSPIPGRPR